MNTQDPHFVVATPNRSVCDDNARALFKAGALRLIALGTRRGTRGIPDERTRLNPAIGLVAYAFARTLPTYWGEYVRFGLLPWFDRWVRRQLTPGDHIISSFGYANESFKWVRKHGGKTFVDGGNSHIENFWEQISEEHRRWGCSLPPFAPHWYERSRRMMEHVDFVLSPSQWVTNSFLKRGFSPDQILRNVYPVDLSCFTPPDQPRPADRPLTIINTGSISLRKGSPYLLEAFRLIRRSVPDARLLLTQDIAGSMKDILPQFSDLPIEWSTPLPHAQLAARLRSADVFVLPSLEEGLARTSLEAMACGLPVVVTAHTGSNDMVKPGVTGEVVPIRDPKAIADAVLSWWERIRTGERHEPAFQRDQLSYERFEAEFLAQLAERGFISLRQRQPEARDAGTPLP